MAQGHAKFIAGLKAAGKSVLKYVPQCGCGEIETPAPPKGEQWDSLSVCPYCGDMYMKVVHHDRVTCLKPEVRQ